MFRSFSLMKKNQKIKAYTPAATNSRRGAEISENSPSAQTAEISFRSAWNLLYAASVRICFTPLPLGQSNGQLTIGNG